MNEEEWVTIPKSQIDMLVLKANIELIQKVDRLVNLIESEIEKAQEKQCCTETTVEQIVLVVSCGTCIMVVSVERKGKSYEIAL